MPEGTLVKFVKAYCGDNDFIIIDTRSTKGGVGTSNTKAPLGIPSNFYARVGKICDTSYAGIH